MGHPLRHSIIPHFLAVGAALWIALGGCPAGAVFFDETVSSGLNWTQPTWGAFLSDLDLDGDLDLCAGHHFYSPILYWNDGTGVFSRLLHPLPWVGPMDRHGAVALPLDGSPLPDIFYTHGGGGGSSPEANELYVNEGDGAFTPVPDAGGADSPPTRTRAVSAADYDGDGLPDLWTGAAPSENYGNALFRNRGGFSFVDVSDGSGLEEFDGTVGGIWGDYDDDGDPDLLVGGEEFPRPTRLYRNDGGVFVDASEVFTPSIPTISGADWGDYDNDGDLDLAVCDGMVGVFDAYTIGDTLSYFFNTRYGDLGLDGLTVSTTADTLHAQFRLRGYQNLNRIFLGPDELIPPNGETILLTPEFIGQPDFQPGVERGTWVWRESASGPWQIRCSTPDINFDTFDGWVTAGGSTLQATGVDLEDSGFIPGSPRVWRNDGGTFQEVTSSLGLSAMVNPRHITWVDYDADGDLDLHVVDMGTSAQPNAPDRLYRNQRGTLTDVTASEGLPGGSTGLADGAVWGDLTGDGLPELFLSEGAGPQTYSANGVVRYYRNARAGGVSIRLDLIGTLSGHAAVGAKVVAYHDDDEVHRRVFANSWRGFMNPLRVMLGIEESESADSVVVNWPSGTRTVWKGVAPGLYTMREDDPGSSTAVEALTGGPAAWAVLGIRPQPASRTQTLCLSGTEGTRLTVRVMDIAGRCVRTLVPPSFREGASTTTWDGRADDGTLLPAGVYFLNITGGGRRASVKSVRIH